MGTMLTTIPDEAMFVEPALQVVGLCQDANAAKLTKQTFERLCVRLPDSAGNKLCLLPFDSLCSRGTEGGIAFGNTPEADVLLVCADGKRPLPYEVVMALDKWVTAPGARFGLAAMLTGIEEWAKEASPAFEQLAAIANRGGIDFFAQAISEPAEYHYSTLAVSEHDSVPLDDFGQDGRNFNHWGINE